MRKIFYIIGAILTLPAFADDTTITSREYVDNVMNTKQDKITTTGTSKLMIYGSSAGDITSRDILTSISSSTADPRVPTKGATYTAVNKKNDEFVNISNQNIVTYTKSSGALMATPIYNNTTNTFANGLIRAETLNTAATNAINNELTCSAYATPGDTTSECLLWQINTAQQNVLTTNIDLPPFETSATGHCARDFGRGGLTSGTCSADLLAYLGASDSKNGRWGVTFPSTYGDIYGVSVCSSTIGQNPFVVGIIATANQASTLDTEYEAQANDGGTYGRYCWCKAINLPIAESRWVSTKWVNGTTGIAQDESGCWEECASHCSSAMASIAGYNKRFRGAMFSASALE